MSKIEEHQERARKHRWRARGLVAHYDDAQAEGCSLEELNDILLAIMEDIYQATRNEAYAKMLQDRDNERPEESMWRCIELEKEKKARAGAEQPRKRIAFNHTQFNKTAQILANKAREQRKIKNLFFK